MKTVFFGLLTAVFVLFLAGCGGTDSAAANASDTGNISNPVPDDTQPPAPADEIENTAFTVTVGERIFPATLLDSETAKAFAQMLPMTLDMSELNGNEKYFYMDSQLPADAEQPGQINAGDLMLYGGNCVVLFYKTFSSGYSYTRLGRVDDPSGLAGALGSGGVTVSFQNNVQSQAISQITELEPGFSSASFSGSDGFETFLALGGAASDAEVTQFLVSQLLADAALNSGSAGCSTLSVQSPDGHRLFGRNFDWQSCNALVLTSKPTGAYASISTVNLDFISQAGDSLGQVLKQDNVRVLAALYAPLDGMNEKGLAVSVNMIQDAASIHQDTGRPDITTTTAVRLLLNKAADVDEALELLRQYDLHASMGMMVHFALADASGRSVAVEYIDNQMIVTETPVVTNFYLAAGSKQGIGTRQSHTRYDILTKALQEHPGMSMEDVRDALDSVSKDNFNEFESTEWSAVFDLTAGEAHYYHRENYENRYTFSIGQTGQNGQT